ncbi:MAG TPA: Gfo/Idh/MocA family oxidoreductase [Chloroflexota bacterium]
MTYRYRFGIVGCGVIGKTHAEAIASLPEAALVAVADPVAERRDALAERYAVHAYPDLQSMLNAETLDVVNVCTASGMHGELACTAMRAGKHVVVEKPIEVTLPAIDEMLRVQRETGVKLAVISQHRFDPASQRLHRLIADRVLGTPVLGNAHILWWRSQGYYDSGEWRGTWVLDGGGVLMNQSIHSIDLLHWFFGPVQSVSAYTATRAHRMETEDTAAAALRFESGALGSIAASTSAYPGVSTRIEILGDRGSAIIENDRLRYLHLARDDREEVGPYGLEGTEQPPAEPGMDEGNTQNTHALQIADMIDAIREDGTPLVDGMAARHDVAIILAIYESARTGREVMVP